MINDTTNGAIQIKRVLVASTTTFVLGFGLIYFFLKPSDAPLPTTPSSTHATGTVAPHASTVPDVSKTTAPVSSSATPPSSPAPAPAVAPGPIPDGVFINETEDYLKCWNTSGIERDGDHCDPLPALYERVKERLYVIDDCRKDNAGPASTGTLTIAAEIDFDNMTASFWNHTASTISQADHIGSCLRDKLIGIPLTDMDHQHQRYRIVYTVEFGSLGPSGHTDASATADASIDDAPSQPDPGKGRLVAVIKDKVNVREAPTDGNVFGRISTGNQVRLLKQDGEWCQIVTPNNNTGWMICHALEL